MYNRYTPTPDGSYQRRHIQDEPTAPPVPEKPPQPAPEPPPCPPPTPTACKDFLKNLLPKNFDTGDLLIVILLLLIAGDNEQHRNTALLTLGMYFLL